MNAITRWYEHPLYLWMNEQEFTDREACLQRNCTQKVIRDLLEKYDNLTLENVEFYPAGTYAEPDKTCLDNLSAFYLIRMRQQVGKNHVGSLRVYLPINWNRRFMGISGAGTNNEVDWFSSVTDRKSVV